MIADLHGRADLLEKALVEIIHHAGGEPGTIVTLGDYVDRGPQSQQIITRLMGFNYPGWILVCLRGNHEDIMLQTICTPMDPSWWMGNGGGATLISYGAKEGQRSREACNLVPKDHLDWLRSLPLMHVDAHRVYVHASVDPTKPLHEQTDHDLTWRLYQSGFEDGHGNFHVVHGHEQFSDGPKLFSGRTDLDTFAWATGRLVVGVFDDDEPGGPVDLLMVFGDQDPRFHIISGGA